MSDLSPSTLAALVRMTLRTPRQAARTVMALPLDLQGRWLALGLVAVLSALVTWAALATFATPAMASLSPVGLAVVQVVVMTLMALIAHAVGRWRGGLGRLEDAVILVAWLQFVLLVVQVAQLVAYVVLPPVGDVLGFVGLVLFFWLMTSFVVELHAFTSPGRVFFGILATIILLAFVFSALLTPFLPAPPV